MNGERERDDAACVAAFGEPVFDMFVKSVRHHIHAKKYRPYHHDSCLKDDAYTFNASVRVPTELIKKSLANAYMRRAYLRYGPKRFDAIERSIANYVTRALDDQCIMLDEFVMDRQLANWFDPIQNDVWQKLWAALMAILFPFLIPSIIWEWFARWFCKPVLYIRVVGRFRFRGCPFGPCP